MKLKKKTLTALVTLVVLLGLFIMEQADFSIAQFFPSEKETVALIRPVDGDTANFSTQAYGTVNVRFSGINTPETKHPTKGPEPYGKEASTFTKAQLENANLIEIQWDSTQGKTHNRPVGIVFVDGVNLNLLLVEKGYADLTYLKDTMPYAKAYKAAEKEAKAKKIGIWQ